MISKIANAVILIITFSVVNSTMMLAEIPTVSEVDHKTSINANLFNKISLDGWYTFLKGRGRNNDPKGVFTVNDSILRISGEEWGCITTEKEYENYHFVAEFKWGEKTFEPRIGKARDSGILLHSIGEDGAYSGTWKHSIECQIIEGGTGDFIVVGDGSDKFSITSPVAQEKQGNSFVFQLAGNHETIQGGRINWYGRDPNWQDTTGFRGAKDVEKPVGEWNKLECIVNQGKITIYLNDILVNKAFSVKPSKGRIQIQSEGAEIFFRRIELTPLPKNYRLIYNSDAGNMFIYKKPPMTPEMLYPYIDEVAETGVTSFFMSPHYGMTMIFPTEVAKMIGEDVSAKLASKILLDAEPKTIERGVINLRSLINAGHDPLGLVIDRARKNGMEAFVSFRLNEVHWVDKDDALILSHFWKEHPEWRIGKNGDSLSQVYLDILGPNTNPIVAGWLPGGLNFAIPEVRAHKLAQMREICECYDIDGLEIDFQRFPMYFKIGEESKYMETMTDWMREIRTMTHEVAAKRGRPILLCARIMAKPEQNLAIGLDPITWANEDLIDFVIVSHYLRNDFPLPIKEYRKLFPKDIPIYASIEVEPKKETYRDIAQQLWKDKVDGILLFNFFTTRERGKEPPFNVIHEISGPQILNTKGQDKNSPEPILLVANKHDDVLNYINLKTLQIIDTVSTGPNPHEIIVTPDQRFAYLSNYEPPGNTITLIDLVQRKHIKQISTGDITRIHGTAMAPDGKHAYFTAGQTGYVVEVDTKTNMVTRNIPTHGKISHMVLVSPDNKRLYTANINSQNVSVIDRLTGELITQIPCGQGAEGMAFTPDGKYLWVANQTGGSITIIDLATHQPIETFDCPGMPVRIRFTDDGKLALIPSWTSDGELIIIDVDKRKEIKRIKVGGYAIGVEITPDGKRAFVGCEFEDGVHVIDMETLTVETVIKTGNGPDPMVIWYPPVK